MKCRVFSTTLVGAAQQWFKQLPSGSVGSFEELYDLFTRKFASTRKSPKSSMHLMTIKQEGEETLREYVSKFNLTALETPGVDAKIKIHAFMQGLRSGPFFDSLVMNEPADFGDFLGRITSYIYLEEARMAPRVEVGKPNKRVENWVEKEVIRNPVIRNSALQGRSRYDNRPREYVSAPPRERAFAPTREQLYIPTQMYPRTINEINEKELIPLNRLLTEILEVARRVPGFYVPGSVTSETRGTPGSLVCRYHNQYGHSTNRCMYLRLLVDKIIREGKQKEFVKNENNSNPKGAAEGR